MPTNVVQTSGAHDGPTPARLWLVDLATGAAYCYATTLVVFLGAVLGTAFVDFCPEHQRAKRAGVPARFAAWDGEWYARIASEGYAYDPNHESSVAFFPAFPLLARGLMAITGVNAETALFALAQVFLLASFVIAARYAAQRVGEPDGTVDATLLALGLFPTTFYFRMAYAESMFLLLTLLSFLAMARRWRPFWIAFIIGAATGTRPVGVALLVPFSLHLWRLSSEIAQGTDGPPPRTRLPPFAYFCARFAVLLPLGCWGILAYIAYQWSEFKEPLAFLKTQAHWGRALAHTSACERGWRLFVLAPIAAVYDPASSCYWRNYPPRGTVACNLMFANPIYFLTTVACVGFGAWKRWLNSEELALSAMLLLIPYVAQADRTCMASQARFSSVVFPLYLVLGQVLARLPRPLVALLAAVSAVMLALYSALFVNWYWFY